MMSALISGSIGFELWSGTLSELCSWARHFTLTVPLFSQVYKWNRCNGLASHPGGSRHTPSYFML